MVWALSSALIGVGTTMDKFADVSLHYFHILPPALLGFLARYLTKRAADVHNINSLEQGKVHVVSHHLHILSCPAAQVYPDQS
eukprot:SM000308S11836  [mRNA]  locus=s308:28601:30177:- [translate_table: standard]